MLHDNSVATSPRRSAAWPKTVGIRQHWKRLLGEGSETAPKARYKVSPARKRWVSCVKSSSPGGATLASFFYQESHPHNFRHQRTTQDNSTANGATGMGIHSRNMQEPSNLSRHCWRNERPCSYSDWHPPCLVEAIILSL